MDVSWHVAHVAIAGTKCGGPELMAFVVLIWNGRVKAMEFVIKTVNRAAQLPFAAHKK